MCIMNPQFLYTDTRPWQTKSSKVCNLSLFLSKATVICQQAPWTFSVTVDEGIVREVQEITCWETGKLLNYEYFREC